MDVSRTKKKTCHLLVEQIELFQDTKMCCLQVASRDQALLKLQTELDTTQEKYSGAVDEVSSLQLFLCTDLLDRLTLTLHRDVSINKHVQKLQSCSIHVLIRLKLMI